jgi:hypothetical protein
MEIRQPAMIGRPPLAKKVTTTAKPRVATLGILVMRSQSHDLLYKDHRPRERLSLGQTPQDRARPHRIGTVTATSSQPPSGKEDSPLSVRPHRHLHLDQAIAAPDHLDV